MFCSKCGTLVSGDSIYCYKCGAKIAHPIPTQPTYANGISNNDTTSADYQPYQPPADYATQENTENAEDNSTFSAKTWLIIGGVLIVGYLLFPGLVYYNIVMWGTFFIGAPYVKKYWRQREFLKMVAVGICVILVMSVCNGFKESHKRTVRENVTNKYSTNKR